MYPSVPVVVVVVVVVVVMRIVVGNFDCSVKTTGTITTMHTIISIVQQSMNTQQRWEEIISHKLIVSLSLDGEDKGVNA